MFTFFLSVGDRISHSYTTVGKIIVLYFLIFIATESRRDDDSL